jgi:chemotaxis protein methyltransferase CheR
MKFSAERLQEAKRLVASRLGLNFLSDREPELVRAISDGARSNRSLEAYLARLAQEAAESPEWKRLTSLLTVGETSFFRDPACMEALEATVLPGLVTSRRAQGNHSLRLWSAGCATGEEAYSLAILLERLLPDRQEWDVTILATDINPKALEKARSGMYGEWSLRNLPPNEKAHYFERHTQRVFKLDGALRGRVAFETENLACGASRAPMDLILCRNVLMYLTPDAMRAAVARLLGALAEDGWLLVAAAEASAERFRPLVAVNLPGAIFFKKADAAPRPARRAPTQRPRGVRGRAERLPAKASVRSVIRKPPEAQPPETPTAEALLARARAAADRGSLDEALGLCQLALGREPLLAEPHRLLGAIHQERGDTDAALIALRRAVYLDQDSAEAHLALGHLLLKRCERRRGQKHIETAARLGNRTDAS